MMGMPETQVVHDVTYMVLTPDLVVCIVTNFRIALAMGPVEPVREPV